MIWVWVAASLSLLVATAQSQPTPVGPSWLTMLGYDGTVTGTISNYQVCVRAFGLSVCTSSLGSSLGTPPAGTAPGPLGSPFFICGGRHYARALPPVKPGFCQLALHVRRLPRSPLPSAPRTLAAASVRRPFALRGVLARRWLLQGENDRHPSYSATATFSIDSGSQSMTLSLTVWGQPPGGPWATNPVDKSTNPGSARAVGAVMSPVTYQMLKSDKNGIQFTTSQPDDSFAYCKYRVASQAMYLDSTVGKRSHGNTQLCSGE
jgi:hypothetical protein